jgi:AAA domain
VPELIDGVLPSHRVHLLGGISDAGKTRWALPAFVDWAMGLPVFGNASNPVPWAYVAADRTLREATETISSLQLNPGDIRVIPAFGMHNKSALSILHAAKELVPIPQFLLWESFQDMCGHQRDEVKEFLGQMCAFCESNVDFPLGLTILGICESPKQKPFERYSNPRQRVSGSSAWGYHSGTIIMIESTDADPEMLTDDRVVWVCAKKSKRRKLAGQFDAIGRLIVP